VTGTHLEPATNFPLSPFDYFLDSFGFVDVLERTIFHLFRTFESPYWTEVRSDWTHNPLVSISLHLLVGLQFRETFSHMHSPIPST
jgi:hypothetical protein